MNRCLSVATLAALFGVWAGAVHAGEEPSPRAIVEKAIKAHGGEVNLAKYPAVTMKGKGIFYGMGQGIPYSAEWAFQGSTQSTFLLEIDVDNMIFKFARGLDGDKGWVRQMDQAARPMPKDELAEEQEKLYAGRLGTLLPLRDKDMKLSVIGDDKVGDIAVVGIRVSKKDHRDVNLYFDKKTGMLLKHETQVKDFMAGGVEFRQTTFYKEHKEFKGLNLATKVVIQKDGERFVEAEMTEVVPHEKLDKALFMQP